MLICTFDLSFFVKERYYLFIRILCTISIQFIKRLYDCHCFWKV